MPGDLRPPRDSGPPDGLPPDDDDIDDDAEIEVELDEALAREILPIDNLDDPGDDANEADEVVEREANHLQYSEHIRLWHDAFTNRIKAYAEFLTATLPKIGEGRAADAAEADVDPDITTSRNLALEAIFKDVRRMASPALGYPTGPVEDVTDGR